MTAWQLQDAKARFTKFLNTATARVHRLKVATRNPSDFALLGVDLCNPFKN